MSVLRFVADLLAPARCVVCRRRRDSMVPPWCGECARRVEPADPDCPRCAARAAGPGSPGPCPLRTGPVDRVHAPWWWAGTVADAVRAGKLDGVHAVFAPLGSMVAAQPAVRAVPAQLVVAVPTSPARRRRRGFDHAHLLATAVARALDLPHRRALRVTGRAADRGFARDADGGIDAAWIRAADVRPVHPVPPRVLLVDDVVTSGTSVVAAAAALRRAGARRVDVAAVARAGRH